MLMATRPLAPLQTLLSIFVTLVALVVLPASANAQRLLPGMDLAAAQESAASRFTLQELASASNVIGNDAYGLFFRPPQNEFEWGMQAKNYMLLLALSQEAEEDVRQGATVLAAAAALNGGREDHAEALATQALTMVSDAADRKIAAHVLAVINDQTDGDYPAIARDRIWRLSRSVGIFGPYASLAQQEGDFTQLCLDFSEPIGASHRVDYRDLITVTPTPSVQRFVVRNSGYRLCIVGTAFEQSYEVVIAEGLRSREGERLRESVVMTLTTPGRKAEIRMPGQGYTLPASGAQLVPVETVNVEDVLVGLYHLEERNINQVLRRGVLSHSASDLSGRGNVYDYVEDRMGGFRDKVRPVFNGTLSVEMLKHQRRRDGISITDMLDGPAERGLYLMTLQQDQNSDVEAIKWIMVSDLALTTVDTPEGLFINAINTETGAPVFDGVDVQLVTRGNRALQPVNTENAATAFFAAPQLNGKDANEPLYLYASHPVLGDAFLSLGRAPIEIETLPGLMPLNTEALELWAKADRGQYREGETARVVGLLRPTRRNDPDVLLPKTLLARVVNPSGEVVHQYDISLATGLGFETEVSLPLGARQGRWSLDLTLGRGMPVLRSVPLRVTEFVPPSVEIELEPVAAVTLDGSDQIEVQVDYLYGAPARNLRVAVSGRLTPRTTLQGFQIGLEQEEFIYARPFDLSGTTDETGQVIFEVPAFAVPDQTLLADVVIEAVVTDAAGRQERTSTTAPLADDRILIGLSADFDSSDPVAEGSEVSFTAAALTSDGTITATQADWVLYREIYDYNWYFDGGRWNYESTYIDLPVAEGSLALEGETGLNVDVDWGAYRLEIVSASGLSATSLRFNAGWRALPQRDRAPGRLGVTLANDRPNPGDTVNVLIDAPHAGAGLAYLVGSETKVIDLGTLAEGANRLSLDIPESWADVEGVWLLPVVYSTGAVGVDQLPSRAVGAAFIGFDQSRVLLDVATTTEPTARPRSTLSIPVSVGAMAPGEQGYALAWLVDDGVLSATGYTPPNPAAHFLSAYALPADLRDTFASMIASAGLEAAPLKQGYDGMFASAMRAMSADAEMLSLSVGLTTRIKETLALSSAIVPLNAQGEAELSVALPDFAGRGRLMTLAWTDQGRMGAQSETIRVFDPIVADLFLPRFLAPGDEVDVKLTLTNMKDTTAAASTSTSATVSLELGAGLSLVEGASQMTLALQAGKPQTVTLRLGAQDLTGPTLIRVQIKDGEETLTRTFPIEVRSATPREVARDSFIVDAGAAWTLDPALLAELDHSAIRMSIAPINAINANMMAQSLSDYPFRCSEQTSSRAFGLLLGDNLDASQAWRETEVNRALVRLQNRRSANGLISLWSSYGRGDLFLHAYASDLLALAEAKDIEGAAQMRAAFDQGLARNLERAEDPYYSFDVSLRTKAYGLAILARSGKADIAAQRLLFDELVSKPGETFAKAALAVAADAVGDAADRDALLDALVQTPATIEFGTIADYGTGFRDQIAALALLAEADLISAGSGQSVLEARLPTLARTLAERTLTTQEQAWALRLSEHLGEGTLAFTDLSGEPGDTPVSQSLTPGDFNGENTITNTGEDPMLVSIWQAGSPLDVSSIVADGITIERYMRDLDTLLPIDNPAPGQRLLVSLVGTAFSEEALDYVIADLLPAGFEVEETGLPSSVLTIGGMVGECPQGKNALAPAVCDLNGESAFQQSGAEYAEARADRVLFGFRNGAGSFAHHYVVRRTQPGSVIQPGAYIEAMYAPDIRARSAARQLR